MTNTASRLWWAVGVVTLLSATAVTAQRREFVGPGKCTDCHDHKDEKEWSEKRDGDGKGKQHINALNQLADKKAEEYAKAIGLADVYDVKGTCVRCHATVVRGSADFGISCESCHGAGKDYLKPHQEKGAYQASLALGLKDYLKKPEAWARECVTCHVLGENPGDAALLKAGHTSGSDFNLGLKYQTVSLHWTSKYTANQITALGNPLRDMLAKRATASAPTAVAAAAPAAPAPAPAVVTPPAATPAAPTPAAPVAAPATPARAAAPVPPPVAAPAATPPAVAPARAAAPTPTTPAPAPAPRAPAVAPPVPSLPPPPPPPASPVIPADPGVAPTSSPAALVGALQGRVAQLLTDLLSRGVRTPVKLTAPATKTPYRGADAELLRLQEEVIALALEALGTSPPAKTAPKQ